MITIDPPSKSPSTQLKLSKAGLARFLTAAQKAVGLEGEVHVLLADDATLRRLNRRFLGHDKATDVLSFPIGATAVFGRSGATELVGDLAISLETAARQARKFGHSLRDEVRVLLLHGTLHLAGFDHDADSGEMAAREAELREELGLPAGLIARANRRGLKLENGQKQNAGVLRYAQDDKLRVGGKSSGTRVRA